MSSFDSNDDHRVIQSLRAEVEQLRAERDEVLGHGVVVLMDKVQAEVKRLKVELEDTRAAYLWTKKALELERRKK